jgi:hypothetical protein
MRDVERHCIRESFSDAAMMADQHVFRACLKPLAHGKVPGQDGVVNEVWQMLPKSEIEAMHQLLQIVWATGHTPAAWKYSITVLLYKNKGGVLSLDFYRRIGLENTHCTNCGQHSAWQTMRSVTASLATLKLGSKAGGRQRTSWS